MVEVITCLWNWTHPDKRLQQYPEDPELLDLFKNKYLEDVNIVDDVN